MAFTKIIATLGPESSDYDTIKGMVLEGARGFRINMVYGDISEKEKIIKNIRAVESELGIHIPILAEIKGRTLRIGSIPPSEVTPGEKLVFRFGEQKSDEPHIIPIPYDMPTGIIKNGDRILMADGRIVVRVDKVVEDEFEGTVVMGGILRSKARIAIRKKSLLRLPPITREDERDLKFILRYGVDIVMIPDVIEPSDLDYVKEVLTSMGAVNIKVFSRIENADALPKLLGIAKKSDAIVFAKENIENMLVEEERPIADLFLEDFAVKIALKASKPIYVVVPTLESLLKEGVMKRQDVAILSNIANKGFDGVILCSETAIGVAPISAVRYTNTILRSTEDKVFPPKVEISESDPEYVKFNRGLLELARLLGAKIGIYTTTGKTALAISKFRPKLKIFAFTDNINTAKYLNIVWGVHPILLRGPINFEIMTDKLSKLGLIERGDRVVLSYGWRPEMGNAQYLLIRKIG